MSNDFTNFVGADKQRWWHENMLELRCLLANTLLWFLNPRLWHRKRDRRREYITWNFYDLGACPLLCGGHGDYKNGECTCHPGWKGKECSLRHDECEVSDCSSRGRCVEGHCQCIKGFTGTFCEKGKKMLAVLIIFLWRMLFLNCSGLFPRKRNCSNPFQNSNSIW